MLLKIQFSYASSIVQSLQGHQQYNFLPNIFFSFSPQIGEKCGLLQPIPSYIHGLHPCHLRTESLPPSGTASGLSLNRLPVPHLSQAAPPSTLSPHPYDTLSILLASLVWRVGLYWLLPAPEQCLLPVQWLTSCSLAKSQSLVGSFRTFAQLEPCPASAQPPLSLAYALPQPRAGSGTTRLYLALVQPITSPTQAVSQLREAAAELSTGCRYHLSLSTTWPTQQ